MVDDNHLSLSETESTNDQTVLLVDDDDDFLFQQRLHLETAGFDVLAAQGRREAQEMLLAAAARPGRRRRDDGAPGRRLHALPPHPQAGPLDPRDPGDLGQQRDRPGLRRCQPTEDATWIKADALLAKPIRFEQLQREIDRLLAAKPAAR